MDNIEMTVTEGSAGSSKAQPPASETTPNDLQDRDLDLGADGSEELDEFAASSLTDEEPDTLAFDEDPEADAEFSAEADPDVAAVDSAMSASRKQRAADKNNNVRRLLEERSEARRLEQELDYLDFDD